MNKYVLVTLAVLCAAAAFGTGVDRAPGAGAAVTAPEAGTDAWGQLIRSWAVTSPTGVKTGSAYTNDNYWITGAWTSFTAFGVYSSTGSLVRTVSASGVSGMRDGTFKCHLGTGYFVICTGGPGPAVYFRYTTGGNPGSTPAGNLGFNCGRGIAWNGTYYYATTGSWSTPVGYYTTTGSLVGTLPVGSGVPLYGIAMNPSVPTKLITWDQRSGSPITEFTTAGSQVRSFTTVSSSAGGIDPGWSDGYLYGCSQTPNSCLVYDGELRATGVTPKSLGKIKAVYR